MRISGMLFFGVLFNIALGVQAERLVLKPENVVSLRADTSQTVVSTALKFDLSQIPAGSRIDLAELKVFMDVDSSFDEAITLSIGVAAEAWSGAGATQSKAIASSDSLYTSVLVEPGYNRVVEIDLTEFVTLWIHAAVTNYGIVLSSPGNVNRQVRLADSYQGEVAALTVFYTALTPSE